MDPFTRTRQLLGENAMRRLRGSCVAVFGLGGVGSWAAEALARAGVGRLRLVDFDSVKPSNINRQCFALASTVGKAKTAVARERLLDINPSCDIDIRHEFAEGATLPSLLAPPPDIVIDAIDSLGPKVWLIYMAVNAGLTVISSMGAAGRTDPSMVRVGDLAETRNCPLARFVRKKLRKLGMYKGVRCVYSIEPARHLAVADGGEEDTPEFVKGRRRKPMGSISFLPGIFGFFAAAEAVNILLRDNV